MYSIKPQISYTTLLLITYVGATMALSGCSDDGANLVGNQQAASSGNRGSAPPSGSNPIPPSGTSPTATSGPRQSIYQPKNFNMPPSGLSCVSGIPASASLIAYDDMQTTGVPGDSFSCPDHPGMTFVVGSFTDLNPYNPSSATGPTDNFYNSAKCTQNSAGGGMYLLSAMGTYCQQTGVVPTLGWVNMYTATPYLDVNVDTNCQQMNTGGYFSRSATNWGYNVCIWSPQEAPSPSPTPNPTPPQDLN